MVEVSRVEYWGREAAEIKNLPLMKPEDYKGDSSDPPEDWPGWEVKFDSGSPNVITSLSARHLRRDDDPDKGLHLPVIDVDFTLRAIPSQTPGHSHLYIDKYLTWSEFKKLLNVLVEVGLVQEGYRNSAFERGYTCVRLPLNTWMKGAVEFRPSDDGGEVKVS
jgi:hypothetical protein